MIYTRGDLSAKSVIWAHKLLQFKESFGIIAELKSGTRVPVKLGLLVFQVVGFHYERRLNVP